MQFNWFFSHLLIVKHSIINKEKTSLWKPQALLFVSLTSYEKHEADKRLVCRVKATTFKCEFFFFVRRGKIKFFSSHPLACWLARCFKCLRENTTGAKRQNVTILNRRTAFISFYTGEHTVSLVSVCCFLRLFELEVGSFGMNIIFT